MTKFHQYNKTHFTWNLDFVFWNFQPYTMRKVKTFQIDIPKPCDEKWLDMMPAKGGRHCERCEKTIVDFTDKTDREIAHLYKQSEGKLCGRFSPDQLNRDIVLHPKSSSQKRLKAVAALLAGMLSTGTAVAQGEVVVHRTEQHISEKESESEAKTSSGGRVITGQVTDETGEPLPFANVFINNTCIGTTTDIDGYYSLQIPEHPVILVVAYTGFADVKVDLNDKGDVVDVVIDSEASCLLSGDIVIVNSSHSYFQDTPRGRTFPQLIKDWIRNIKEKRSNKKPKSQPETLPSPIENTRVVEQEIPDIPLQIITKKLITNIFPNPFDNKIHITLESELTETRRVVVYDSMSREIHREQINILAGTNEFDLNLEEKQLTKGSYFVSIFRDNEVIQTEILTRTKK